MDTTRLNVVANHPYLASRPAASDLGSGLNAETQAWRRHRYTVLSSDPVAGSPREPAPPPEWAPVVRQLISLARAPVPAPPWWAPKTAYSGAVETRTAPHDLDPTATGRDSSAPRALYLTLTLAGWGYAHTPVEAEPEKLTPGTVSFSAIPPAERCYVPAESPGWTYVWTAVYHPYLRARIARQVSSTGSLFVVPPQETLTASILRLARGAIKKDFRDRFDAEMAQFEFVLAFERWAESGSAGQPSGQRLMDEVRSFVVANLPKAVAVDSLAAQFCMTRSHFSRFFRERTGLTPSHFATEVRIQEAARMLRETRAPLKAIAFDCGFANTNHFCKVFRRFFCLSPTALRELSATDATRSFG